MAYPFPVKEHRIYKNTTLSGVFVSLDYRHRENSFFDKEFYSRLDAYTSKNFSLTVDHQLFDKAFQIRNDKNGAVLMFFNGTLLLGLDKDRYVSFNDSAISQIHKMKLFVSDVLCEERVKRANIRKLNIWQVQDVKNDPNRILRDMMTHIFSDALLDSDAEQHIEAEEKGVIKKYVWEEEELNEKVTVRIAFVKVNGKEDAYNLVFDTDLEIMPERGLTLEGLTELLKERNSVLFNAYHWCVREEVIKQMEEA
ncbi:hypothetical protein L6470_01090 [Prevotella communis]|uniref:hypothetical protein n=1 Tax=Prevotella communis TaxID=2913614 RepID=UPI001EDB56F5|nr:hypothetical protein [Prevotella communis]UKK59641.1 hypothetical protein L6470_01090 [Prevotella communis]